MATKRSALTPVLRLLRFHRPLPTPTGEPVSSLMTLSYQALKGIMEDFLPDEEVSAILTKIRKETLEKLENMIGINASLEVSQRCAMFTCDWRKEYSSSEEFYASTGASKVIVENIDGRLRVLARL